MAFTKTLTPPIDSTVEEEKITFDFGPELALPTTDINGNPVAGVTIQEIISTTCTAVINAALDSNPSSRIVGSPLLTTSPSTLQPNCAVIVLVGTMIGTVIYLLQCVVLTTDGQRLSLWGYLPCATPE